MSRDEFSAATKRRIASRAGYLCAYPGCPHPRTIGAAMTGDGVVVVGIAAHITAASPKGPRFDSQLKPAQRSHASNGVWMCNVHGKAVDDDAATFTVDELLKWKATAEKQSLPNVWTGEVIQGLVAPEEDSPEAALLAALGLPTNTNLDAITARSRAAAKVDLKSFQDSPSRPAQPVLLDLTLESEGTSKRFSADGLATAAEAHQSIIVRAPPGVGKTTTLLQAADALLAQDSFIPLFVPLPEWSWQTGGVFRYVADRQAFFSVSEAELRLLASFGRLVLFLDGWNELDGVSRRRAAAELEAVQRQFPELGLVLSTRRQAMDVPIDGPMVRIEPLTEKQQLAIARRRAGEGGAALLDQAWRTPGVRDLVSIPLYLNALLKSATGDELPTTKEAILRLFVEQHLGEWRRRDALDQTFSGHESDFLEALAVSATFAANTTIQAETARSVISSTADRLSKDGQFYLRTQPAGLLDVLVSEHSLVVSGTAGFTFQHQQFQEWYASLEAERVMVAASGGDIEGQRRLREDILNLPVWEEAVLFAIERLSRRGSDDATAAAAAGTLEALTVDPLLAAEMIFRAAPAVWDLVKARSVDLAMRWHTAGEVDRAARFMITTGKPEFSKPIWSLIETETEHRHISVFDVARRFRARVLLPEDKAKLQTLPDDQRRRVLADLAYDGDMEAIELASEIAADDSNPEVQIAVIEACLFRRAEKAALAVLRRAEGSVWASISAHDWANEITDAEVSARLRDIEAERSRADTTGMGRLAAIARMPTDAKLALEAQTLIEDPAFPATDPAAGSLVARLHERYPDNVVGALIQRLTTGASLPFGGSDLVRESGVTLEEGPLAEFVLSSGPTHGPATTAAALVGPGVVGQLLQMQIDYAVAWRAADQPQRSALYEANRWISDRLYNTAPTPFCEGLLSRPDTDDLDEIAELAELLALQGNPGGEPTPLAVKSELAEKLRGRLLRWAQIFVDQAASVSRYQRDRLIKAMARLADERFVPLLVDLLKSELSQWRGARAARAASRARPSQGDDGTMWYFRDYRRAFAAVPGTAAVDAMLAQLADPDIGIEAAQALKAISEREERAASDNWRPISGRSFADVEAWREQRQSGVLPAPSPISAAILEVVEQIMAPPPNSSSHGRALALAAVAFQLPHEDNNALVDDLLALPGNNPAKLHLATVRLLTGHRVRATTALTGLAELLEIERTKVHRRSDLDNSDVLRWVALLPLTDEPDATLVGLDQIAHLHPQPWQLREVISALAASRSDEAEHVLLALPARDPQFLKAHDWRAAVERRRTVGAGRALLELALTGSTGLSFYSVAQAVSEVMADNPSFRDEVYARYDALPYCEAATVLATIIAEKPDTDAVMLLIKGYAKRGPDFDGVIGRAIEKLVVGERTSKEWAGATERATERVSEPAPELRKALLALTVGATADATLASLALTVIDSLRDHYGLIDVEPRHPDLSSGLPWPRV